jgi:hypothetical protein
MANQDLNAIRDAIAEKQGRKPRSGGGGTGGRRRRTLRPDIAVRDGGDAAQTVFAVLLTLLGIMATISALQLAQLWIGDHAASHGKEWPVFRALGFKPWDAPKGWGVINAVLLEYRLFPYLVLLAVIGVAYARSGLGLDIATEIAFFVGIVPGLWWQHIPTWRMPNWVGTMLDKQSSWQANADPWRMFVVFLVIAVVAAAWARKVRSARRLR